MLAQAGERPFAEGPATGDWSLIKRSNCPMVVEPREIAALADAVRPLARGAPFERRGAGTVAEAVAMLGDMPSRLRADIAALAERFVQVMAVPAVRIRLEVINTNACRKIHADYTDVRLITTYLGQGTDYVPDGLEAVEANLVRLPAGYIGLFKGRLFDSSHSAHAHRPCFHRSPPVGDMQEQRLVLVIDTPLDETRMGVVLPPAGGC